MTRGIKAVSVLLMALHLSGCAVYMAASQPSKKDTSVLNAGMSRDLVIAEYGMPVGAETVNGDKVEMYKFVQGYSKGTKIGRAVMHGIFDLGTIFIWELIGMPIEAVANGRKTIVKVTYDAENRVKDFRYLEK